MTKKLTSLFKGIQISLLYILLVIYTSSPAISQNGESETLAKAIATPNNNDLLLSPPKLDYAKTCNAPEERVQNDSRDWNGWDGKSTNVAPKALYKLSWLYNYGSKTTVANEELAVKMLQYLATHNSAVTLSSKYLLAKMYMSGRGIGQDINKAQAMFKEILLAKAGGAGFELGLYHLEENNYSEAEKYFKISSNAGNVNATWYLASLYHKSLVPNSSPEKANILFKTAQNKILGDLGRGNCHPLYHLGRSYIAKLVIPRNEEIAVKWLEAAVATNDTRAMILLATLYRRAVDIPLNMPRAIELWKLAAANGSAIAMYNLGESYIIGNGVKPNAKESIAWLEKAIKRNNAEAFELLIHIYQGKYSYPADEKKAVALMEKAITNPKANVEIIYDLAKTYSGSNSNVRDYTKSFNLFQKATKSGNIEAAYELGKSYQTGRGVEINHKSSLKFFRLAANRGNKDAMIAMRDIYSCGIGTVESPKKAEKWQEKALLARSISAIMDKSLILLADGSEKALKDRIDLLNRAVRTNDRKSMIVLGESYLTGIGVAKDKEKAKDLFKQAIADGKGQSDGIIALAKSYGDGKMIKQNISIAIKMLEKLAENNNKKAAFELGKLLLKTPSKNGDNLAKAQKYLTKSADQNHSKAMMILANFYNDEGISEKYASQTKGLSWQTRAANAGEIEAMMQLAYLHKFGISGKQASEEKAKHWMEKAISSAPCNIKERLDVAKAYELGVGVEQNRETAEIWMKKAIASEISKPSEMMIMGEAYLNGYGTKPDSLQAIKWFEKAAKHGDKKAMRSLGRIYLKGTLKGKNIPLAISWFKKSANLGDISSLTEMGKIHAYGIGTPRDRKKAIEYLTKAADLNSMKAINELGILYSDRASPLFNNQEAAKWLNKAVDRGNVEAMFTLLKMLTTPPDKAHPQAEIEQLIDLAIKSEFKAPSDMLSISEAYARGIGVEKDVAESLKWLQKAAEAGDPESMRKLARHLKEGKIINKDMAKAISWFKKAASLNDYSAMVDLARAYAKGDGVDKNMAEGFRYFNQAAEGGYTAAMREVAYLYVYGTGVAIDPAKGMAWFKKAATAGDTKSMVELANGYISGFGVTQSTDESNNLAEKSRHRWQ